MDVGDLGLLFDRERRAWSVAARTLGLEFEAPFYVEGDSEAHEVAGRLKYIGTEEGTVILLPTDELQRVGYEGQC